MEANYSMPTVPITAGSAGYGMDGGMGFLPFLLGALFSGNGVFGGRGSELNTAVNANQSGQIAGLQAGVANLERGQDTNTVLGAIGTSRNDVNSLLLRTNDAIDTYAQAVQVGLGDVKTSQAAGNFTTLQSINDLGRDVTAQSNQNALNQLNSFNVLNTSMLQGFNTISANAAQNANQLIMGQNNLARDMDKCCCEIKEKVTEDGNLTRTLINELEVKRLTEALNDSKGQVSNNSQTNALIAAMAQQTNTIIAHLVDRRPGQGN